MKRLKFILLLIGILLTLSMVGRAQNRAEKTSSAQAYYGETPKPSKQKFNKKNMTKVSWRTHSRPARGTHTVAYDKKRRWAKS